MMPELDGFGLLRELRADEELRNVPVLLLSARAGEEARLEGLAASADDYLVKPFSARDLLGRVDAQILKSRTRAIERRHAQRLTSLFAHAPVAIAVLRGPEHVYELANEHYLRRGRRTGAGRQADTRSIAGTGRPGHFRAARCRPADGRTIYRRVDGGDAESRPSCRAGTSGVSIFVYQPLFDDAGGVEAIVVVAHDVTALATAKQEAEAANRLKDEFLATLSHELRTPLNAVLGYTQMLRGGVIATDRIPSILETIERNAKLQEQLVSDVLDVSRIITGKLRLDIRPVNLADVIQERDRHRGAGGRREGREAAADARSARRARGRRCATAAAGRVEPPLERREVHAARRPGADSPATRQLARRDHRQRHRRRHRGRISPPSVPAISSRRTARFTRPHSGLGLGLAISRHLVEAHGGHIEAASPGKGLGTTVRVELPLMIVHDQACVSPDRVHPSADVQPVDRSHPPGSHRHSRPARRRRRRCLADGARTRSRRRGRRWSPSRARRRRWTRSTAARSMSLLLDIGMPEVDGYQLLARIRQSADERRRTLPAAALTAYARSIDRTRSLKAGFQMHLSKPVQPAELAAVVLALAATSEAHRRHNRTM